MAGTLAKVGGGVFALFALAAVFGGPEKDGPDGLPARDWSHHAEGVAKRNISRDLRDPGSAEFRNVRTYRQHDPRERAVCGEVNAKNAFGGYAGFRPFVAVVTYGGVQPNGDTRFDVRKAFGDGDVGALAVAAMAPQHCREVGADQTAPPVAPPAAAGVATARPQPAPPRAPSGAAATSAPEAATMKQAGNVRSAPSGAAPVVRTASAGTALRVFSQSGAWYEVGDTQPWGFVHASLLALSR